MAIITFEDYLIEKSNYEINRFFKGTNNDDKIEMPLSFSAKVGVNKREDKGFVTIDIFLGDISDQKDIDSIPFSFEVTIRGIFTYKKDDLQSTSDLKQVLSSNAIAILYPYLRTYISTITNLANNVPPYTLPVMNFAEIVKEEGLVTFVGFED